MSASPPLPHYWQRLSDSDKVALTDTLRVRAARDLELRIAARPSSSACDKAHQRASIPDYPAPSDIPDYRPPFGPLAVYADADDNLWIRDAPNPEGGNGAVYLVVNKRGTVIDRVQIPGGTIIRGFGPGVYLVGTLRPGHEQLVEARIR